MNITVSGRNVSVPQEVRDAIEVKLAHVSKIVDGMDRAEVVFKEEKNPRIADKEFVEVTLEGHGHHVRCKATGPDQLAALDKAVDKLGKQLRKLKTKMLRRSHAKGARPAPEPAATDSTEVEFDQTPSYRIVKTKSFELKRMLPEEAIERMHLLEHDWFLFASEETGRPCVVYVRGDGHIGLIDSDA